MSNSSAPNQKQLLNNLLGRHLLKVVGSYEDVIIKEEEQQRQPSYILIEGWTLNNEMSLQSIEQ